MGICNCNSPLAAFHRHSALYVCSGHLVARGVDRHHLWGNPGQPLERPGRLTVSRIPALHSTRPRGDQHGLFPEIPSEGDLSLFVSGNHRLETQIDSMCTACQSRRTRSCDCRC
ncbi:MAG: hypothetical protein CM1200mP2_02390 [Planctomycetaceae bacterium]|nr:MAG: hypothetical protein CM1200mP2_02390 [Planctomycetaceae bacterium]